VNNTAVNVLIWIGIVFAAGFVGYFGRHLAMVLIERTRRRKPESLVSQTPPPASSSLSEVAVATQTKVDKKRAKAEAKKAKKESG